MPTNRPEVVLPEKLELRMEVERIIQRRWFDNKIDGYLLDMATEIVDTLTRPAAGDFVMVPRELTSAMRNALSFDTAFMTHEEMNQTWLETLEAAQAFSAAPQQHGQEVVDDWRDRERLSLLAFRTLLEGFEVSIEAAPLEPPATYLDRVTLTREFQPGGGGPELAKRIAKALSESPRGIAQQPAEAVAVELWCLHLQGPDDVHAAPSKAEAERVARNINDQFASHEVKPNAVAALWPHSPESHAESLKDWRATWGEHGIAGGSRDRHAQVYNAFYDAGEKFDRMARWGNVYAWILNHQTVSADADEAASPPPAIDIGKLRELVARWRNLDTDFAAYKGCADELAALIGDGGEKVNG